MVSIRRRRLLGLCSGKHSFLVQFPKISDNGNASGSPIQKTNSNTIHPLPSVNISQQKELNISKAYPGSSNISGLSSSKEDPNQQHSVYLCLVGWFDSKFSKEFALEAANIRCPLVGQSIKRRKRHRRKHFKDQEPCVMRGVYFKNMKWQAAIKVDKKQIHLGTVGSQVEAARLYDRAAFMCGREPNFELSEEEKQELRGFKWDEFLTVTRSSITNKRKTQGLRC